MSPVAVVGWVASAGVAVALGAAVWTEPQLREASFWLLPLGAMAWIFVAAGLGIPALALLKLLERSTTLYVLLVTSIGVAIGAGVGIPNGAVIGGAISVGVLYALAAVGIVMTMEANSTPHPDARASAVLDQPTSARAGERGR